MLTVLAVDWDTTDVTDDVYLEAASRFLLAALLKHCGLASPLIQLHQHDMAQFYRFCCCCCCYYCYYTWLLALVS